GFEQQHAHCGIGRETVGEDTAGRTRTNDDVIVFAFAAPIRVYLLSHLTRLPSYSYNLRGGRPVGNRLAGWFDASVKVARICLAPRRRAVSATRAPEWRFRVGRSQTIDHAGPCCRNTRGIMACLPAWSNERERHHAQGLRPHFRVPDARSCLGRTKP